MTNTNPFRSPEKFTPHISEAVTAAYERNRALGLMSGGGLATELSVQGLGDIVKAATAEAIATKSAGLNALEQIKNPETQQAFEASFKETERLFDYIHVTAPTPEDCIAAEVDMRVLSDAYERMQLQGLDPEIVLSPALDPDSWHQLYQCLMDDPVVNVGSVLKGDGLGYFDEEMVACWHGLMSLPYDVPTITANGDTASIDRTLTWSIRLVPGTPSAPTTPTRLDIVEYPTISEYLSIQANRFLTQKEPLDNVNGLYSWLRGDFTDSRGILRAPFGCWGTQSGQVGIGCNSGKNRDTLLIAREAVWK